MRGKVGQGSRQARGCGIHDYNSDSLSCLTLELFNPPEPQFPINKIKEWDWAATFQTMSHKITLVGPSQHFFKMRLNSLEQRISDYII